VNFLALEEFANLGDTAQDMAKFRRKHPGFAPPFALAKVGPECRQGWVRPLERPCLPLTFVWRDMLRRVWSGNAGEGELEMLLGLDWEAVGMVVNQDVGGGIRGQDIVESRKELSWVADRWLKAEDAIRGSGLVFAVYKKAQPRIRAPWQAAGKFQYSGNDFENAVFALWRSCWRARVCRMCESYFVAGEKAQKFCSKFCSREGKNQSNRRWWSESGPDWRKRYLEEKSKTEKRSRLRIKL
jgi:hypothetical protein